MFLWNKIELNNPERCDEFVYFYQRRFFKGRPFITEKARGSNALKRDYTSDDQLYDFLDDARCELEKAVLTFNELTDEKAIDYASYNLLAARAKYSYLLKLAKEKKLSL